MMKSSLCILPAIPIFMHFFIGFVATISLHNARNKIGGKIESRADLDRVRDEIQSNLLFGVLLICNCVFMLALMSISLTMGHISFGLLAIYIAGFAIGQVIFSFMMTPIERQFKKLPVVNNDIELSEEYNWYVKQWTGPHIFLKPLDRSQGKSSSLNDSENSNTPSVPEPDPTRSKFVFHNSMKNSSSALFVIELVIIIFSVLFGSALIIMRLMNHLNP